MGGNRVPTVTHGSKPIAAALRTKGVKRLLGTFVHARIIVAGEPHAA